MTNFLNASWENLIMANYAIDPKLLMPYLPFGVELDYYNNETYVSLVGFLFKNTKTSPLRGFLPNSFCTKPHKLP